MQMQPTLILKCLNSRDDYNLSKLCLNDRGCSWATRLPVSSVPDIRSACHCQAIFAKQHFDPTLHLHARIASSPAASFGTNACVGCSRQGDREDALQVQRREQTTETPSRAVKTPASGKGAGQQGSLPLPISRALTPAWQTCVFSSHRYIKRSIMVLVKNNDDKSPHLLTRYISLISFPTPIRTKTRNVVWCISTTTHATAVWLSSQHKAPGSNLQCHQKVQ